MCGFQAPGKSVAHDNGLLGDFPKLGVPFLGVPIIRTIVFWGLHWGPPILGNYHFPLASY